MNLINIVVVNYNGSEDTINCIESFCSLTVHKLFLNFFIVDNNSVKIEIDLLRNYVAKFNHDYIKLNLIENNENIGFAGANNIALNELKKQKSDSTSYIWFLNNDTLINENLMVNISNHLPKDNEVFYFEMRDFNNNYVNDGLNYISRLTGKYSESKKICYTEYICGASILMKKSESIVFWDDKYFLYFEDVDYSFRLKKSGYSFKKINNVYYNHKINASSNKVTKTTFYRLESQKRFMKKYGYSYLFFYISKFFYLLITGRKGELKYFINSKYV